MNTMAPDGGDVSRLFTSPGLKRGGVVLRVQAEVVLPGHDELRLAALLRLDSSRASRRDRQVSSHRPIAVSNTAAPVRTPVNQVGASPQAILLQWMPKNSAGAANMPSSLV
jgi:hypothetical protein